MSINPNNELIPLHVKHFATSLKKLHDRCDFLYSRVKHAVKETLKNHPDVTERWEHRLVKLQNDEHQLFQSLKSDQGWESLEQNMAYFMHELQETADALPQENQPKLGTSNNRTIDILAKETFQLRNNLTPAELQRVIYEEFEPSPSHPFTDLGPDARSLLAEYLRFSDIRNLAQTSRFDATLATTLKSEKLVREFSQSFNNKTLSEGLASIQTLTQNERETIRIMDLSRIGFQERSSPSNELLAILDLCPQLSEVRLAEYFPLNQEAIVALLSNHHIEKLQLLCCTFDQIPIEHLSRITGIQLKPKTDQELQTQIDQLCQQAPNLTALSIKSLTITQIQHLPPNLVDLNVEECSQLQELPELPHTLRSFDCCGCSNLNLPVFSESLRILKCGAIDHMTSLPPLPSLLETLEVRRAQNLIEVTHLPKNLQVANFAYCRKLQRIQHLPQTLRTLQIDGCYALLQFPQFPEGLLQLSLFGLNLVELPPLPDSLIKLKVDFCENLIRIADLPLELQELHCGSCTSLEEIAFLPPKLKVLACVNTALKSLPPLPEEMRLLNCSFNTKLRHLPPLPQTLQTLNVRQSKIYQLPPIPRGCKVIGM